MRRASNPQKLFDVQETVLANGLKVRLIPNPEVPVVSLHLIFQVGSRNERPGITGISHLFEHMMFNGAQRYGPKEFDRELEAAGGRSNAYTSNDLTVYYDDFASEALDKVLDLESDRMASLSLSDTSLASEREVVKEERRLRVDNEVMGMMDEELGSLVYKAHPYRWPVIGWMGDIENIQRSDCEQYFRTYYAPNNALMYVAGDFDPGTALKSIRKHFGAIPKGLPLPPVINSEPPQLGERRAEIGYPAQAPSLMLGYRGPKGSHPDTLALDVLQFVLAVGDGSRLIRELVYRQQCVVALSVDWTWRLDDGMFVIVAELKPDSNVPKVEAALERELAKAASRRITASELEKAKNNLKSHLFRGLTTNNGLAHSLGTHEVFLGSWAEVFSVVERYQAVTAEDVRRVAEKYLSPSSRCVVTVVPRAPAEGTP